MKRIVSNGNMWIDMDISIYIAYLCTVLDENERNRIEGRAFFHTLVHIIPHKSESGMKNRLVEGNTDKLIHNVSCDLYTKTVDQE